MNSLVQIGLTNAVAAAALAVLAAVAGKLCRRPALRHALWLLVIVKLVTPPLVIIPIGFPESTDNAAPSAVQAAQPPAEQMVDATMLPQDKNGNLEAATLENGARLPMDGIDRQELPALARLAVRLLPDTGPEPSGPSAEPPRPEPEFAWFDLPWLTLLGGIWLSGSIVWFTLALLRIRRFQRVLCSGQAGSIALQHEASMLARRMGLRDCPGVCLVPGVVSPLLWAVAGYPRLLLPADLYRKLDLLQRQTLLAHELAHYRRRDHWVRCLEFLALGLYWWFPVVWWVRRELREAEEECCDAWVLWTLPDAARAYASALVETLDFLSNSPMALPPAASGLGQLDLLRRRLTMIMRGTMPRNLGGLGFLAVLGLGVLLLPLVPSWAQQDPRQIAPGVSQDQPPRDLEKAKEELDRASKELQQFKMQLDQMHTDFDRKTKMLEEAQTRLKDAAKVQEMAKKGGSGGGGNGGIGGGGFGGQGGKAGGGFGFFSGPPNPAVDKRLSELEKKLDMVLGELQEMRKTIGKGPGDDPFKGGKKGGGKGKGGFGGGPGGGGKGGPGRPFIPPDKADTEVSFEDSPIVLARDPLPGEIASKKRK